MDEPAELSSSALRALQHLFLEQEAHLVSSLQDLFKDQEKRIAAVIAASQDGPKATPSSPLPLSRSSNRCNCFHGMSDMGTAMASMPNGGVPGSSRERSDVADLEKQLVQEQIVPIPRNNSWSGTERRVESSPELAASRRLREPGGFRRGFLQAQALNEGVQQAELPTRWTGRLVDTLRVQSFQVESHFYGLDLDEDSKDEPPPAGRAGNLSIAFLIFKGNCGCAILYMPRGWMHGGLLLASIAVPLIGFASIWCSLRLLKVRMQTEGYAGYGELMSNAMGVWGRRGTNIFIVLLQSGICCTYFIVACKLLQSTVCPHVGLNPS
eukprot:s2052_g9.t1